MGKQAQQLSDAIDDYMRFRKSLDLAKATLLTQRTVLQRFLAVNGNIWCQSISDQHIIRYFEEAGKTKEPASLRNDYGVLSGFFDWLRQTRRMAMDNNPLYGRRRPKVVKRERNKLSVSKFPALLDAAEARSPRDRAAIAVLLYTLARDAEVTSLRIRDVDLSSQHIRIRRHKTRQEDSLPICSELDAELRRWLITYTEDVGYLEPHFFLVPSRISQGVRGEKGIIRGQQHVRYTPENEIPQLAKIVTPALDDIGFPVRDENGNPLREGAHTIRRSGARAMYDGLVDRGHDGALRIVQSFLGHASLTQTETYVGVTADRRTRDDLFAGKPMYGLGEVTQLRKAVN